MRQELFGDMTNWEIVGEVVGGIAFMVMLGGLCFGILLVGQSLKAMDGHCLDTAPDPESEVWNQMYRPYVKRVYTDQLPFNVIFKIFFRNFFPQIFSQQYPCLTSFYIQCIIYDLRALYIKETL